MLPVSRPPFSSRTLRYSLTSPFFSLPQRFIYFLMSLNRSQPAYAADRVGCFLQVLRISHVKLLYLLYDGELELTAL
jgi:hypothetical protein